MLNGRAPGYGTFFVFLYPNKNQLSIGALQDKKAWPAILGGFTREARQTLKKLPLPVWGSV
jgi:hypothetical protein